MSAKPAILLSKAFVAAMILALSITTSGRSLQASDSKESLLSKMPKYLEEDLLLYYSFDKPVAAQVTDLSGNGNDGKLCGVKYRPEGRYGAAGLFDGVDDFICAENAHLGAFTFAAWIQTSTSSVNNRRVFLFDSGDESFFAVQGAVGGDMEFNTVIWQEDESGWEGDGIETDEKKLEEDVWTHIAATFDGTRAGIYFDGELVQSKELVRKGLIGTLYIGGIEAHDGEFWNGAIDEVAVFKRALFAAEVKSLYDPNEENPLVELKAHCESGEEQSQKLLDILQRVAKAMQVESELDPNLPSGRGIAHFHEIRKKSTDKVNWEKEEEERIIQFQFQRSSSRSDIFGGRKGKPKKLDWIFAENPEYGIRYDGDDVHIEDNEIRLFHRKLGYDMHPDTFKEAYGLDAVRLIYRYPEWVRKMGGRFLVTVSDQGILQFEYERTGDKPGEKARLKARIDLTDPVRLFWLVQSSENYEGPGSRTHIRYHADWQWHGTQCYIREAEFTKEEAEYDDDSPDRLCHRYWQQQVEVLAYDAQAAIPDRAFTLLGLPLEAETDVWDTVRKSRYSLKDALAGTIKPGPRYKSLIGAKLPDLTILGGKSFHAAIQGKRVLVCFFDMNQRPSRHCLRQLNDKTQQFKAQNVAMAAVQAAKVENDTLRLWVTEQNIPFPVGNMEGDIEQVRSTWGVRSLPWLVLTDQNHIVVAEGFALGELDERVSATSAKR